MILVVMGVSGSGKTTIARELASRLRWSFYEGDDFHPASNIEKMKQALPLTDDDRWPWLAAVRDRIAHSLHLNEDAVIACSALKESYRDILRHAGTFTLVYLKVSKELVEQRLAHRQGHFMPPELAVSQFDDLEEPHDAIRVDGSLSLETIVDLIIKNITGPR